MSGPECGYEWTGGWPDLEGPHHCDLRSGHDAEHRCTCDAEAHGGAS